jgi:hypothetical protein
MKAIVVTDQARNRRMKGGRPEPLAATTTSSFSSCVGFTGMSRRP